MCNSDPVPPIRFFPLRFLLVLVAVFTAALPLQSADTAPEGKINVMPLPAMIALADGRLSVTPAFTFAIDGHDDGRLDAAIGRALQRWTVRTGLTFAAAAAPDAASATLVIECQGPGNAIPVLGEDESYTLDISDKQARLKAAAVVGVMRGLQTLVQLLDQDGQNWYLPAAHIRDRPRFPWRGLLIDVARHWQPIDVIKRNLDGMELVKLNVLHLHLTEDQGFRIESKTHPELQEKGSDGFYFTQDQMREIIAYAAARGIRVMPEFDIPGHATSWVVSHPELASMPGPYSIERRWGVFDPVLDPTNEAVYKLLGDFLGEMAALFPDAYIHIGGDENNGVQWNANPRIQNFIREHGLKNDEGLHAYFNHRIGEILAKDGKMLVGWDEILNPQLPKDAVIQSWRGTAALADAARLGYRGILSNGYYIDLLHPAAKHYLVDPLPASTTLTPEEQSRILGGEATMWSERVTPENIDSRIWPRTAAIAERLWSPRDVRDVADMYRRLAVVDARLDEAGLLQDKNYTRLLRRLAGDELTPAEFQTLRVFVDVLEPVKDYRRGKLQPGTTQLTPLDRLADCARPDSASAREFADAVEQFLFHRQSFSSAGAAPLIRRLDTWKAAGQAVSGTLAAKSPELIEAMPVAHHLVGACVIGREAIDALVSGKTKDAAWAKAQLAALDQLGTPGPAAVDLPVTAPLKLLVAAAAKQDKRGQPTASAWREEVRAMAFPDATDAATP